MMIRLKVRQLAENMGYTLSTFQRGASIPMSNARRIWFSTSDGLQNGVPLKSLTFDQLEHLSDFLGVGICDLLERIENT